MINWTEIINEALTALVPICITIIGTMLINFLKKKNATESQIALAKEAYDIVAKAVAAMNQTVVDSLKKNGEFTKEQQIMVKEQCKVLAGEMISEEMRLAIEAIYGSLDVVLDTYIESAVKDAKTK